MTTCVVAAGVGKEGSRKPSLLGRNRHIELATKQQNVRNSNNPKNFEERVFKSLNLATISLTLVIKLKSASSEHKSLFLANQTGILHLSDISNVLTTE